MADSTSLAAQVGGFALPAALKQSSAPVVSSLQWAPYITFPHNSRKDEWLKISMKTGGVKEGEMYYIDGDDIRHLDVMKCSYICGEQHWVKRSPAGELLGYSLEPRADDPWREHVETVLIVYLKEKVVPVNCTFRTTKCGAAKTLDEALRLASTPEWGKMGPHHLLTMQVPQPFFRFYAELTLASPRNSKATGLPYRTLQVKVVPTTSSEWSVLKQMVDDPNTQKALELAADRYKSVLEELMTKAV